MHLFLITEWEYRNLKNKNIFHIPICHYDRRESFHFLFMIILVTFTSNWGLGRTQILGTSGHSNSGEIASVTGYFQTSTTCMHIEYNNYGFPSSTSSLEETIQFIVSGIDFYFFSRLNPTAFLFKSTKSPSISLLPCLGYRIKSIYILQILNCFTRH